MPKSAMVKADAEKPEALAWTAEVAEVLGVPEGTLEQWRSRGKGPAYIKVGRHVRYSWSAVNEWIATNQIRTAAGALPPRANTG